MAAWCRSNPSGVETAIASYTALGVIRSTTPIRDDVVEIDVEDALWAETPYDDKKKIGYVAYCRAIAGKTSDSATVRIRGYRDGEVKARVMDGSWYD